MRLQLKLLPMVGALAVIALAAGAGSAKADIIFGNVNPAPPCQAAPAGQPGHVCGITETFTNGTDIIIATGFNGAPAAPGVANLNLTLKGGPAAPAPLLPTNVLGESGLGTNLTAGPACSTSDCEIVGPTSVAVTAGLNAPLITDAIIGSVQAGETFNFFVELTAGGPFTQLGGTIGSACTGAPGFSVAGPDLCRWDAPAGQTRFGVAVQGVAGDVLLTAVSTVPAPIIGGGLPILLAVGGLLFGAKLFEHSKKRRALQSAIPYAL